jgi:hypothetical protein
VGGIGGGHQRDERVSGDRLGRRGGRKRGYSKFGSRLSQGARARFVKRLEQRLLDEVQRSPVVRDVIGEIEVELAILDDHLLLLTRL